MSKRVWVLLAVMALVAGACSDGDTSESTDSSPTTAVASTAPNQTGAPDVTTTTTATDPSGDDPAPSGGGEGEVIVTVGDTVYELSVADDVWVVGTDSNFPTRCNPDLYGMFAVVAVAESASTLSDPGVYLTLGLPHDPDDPNPVDEPDFQLNDETIPVDYYIPTKDSIEFQLGEFEGDLGSWTVDGNQVHGEITTVTLDPVEYHTVQFDVTCPG